MALSLHVFKQTLATLHKNQLCLSQERLHSGGVNSSRRDSLHTQKLKSIPCIGIKHLSIAPPLVADKHKRSDNKELPPLLVLGPPSIFPIFEPQNLHKFRFLKAFSSPLPLHKFLSTENVDPSSIQAILCNPLQKVSADVIRFLPSLRFIVTSSAGTEHIDLAECRRRDIEVVSVGALFAEDVADMAVGMFIDLMWKISVADRHVRKWGTSKPCTLSPLSKLGGKRVGIVGLGRIGGEVGRRLEAFDCRVMYHSRTKKPFVSYPFYSNVVELARESDVLVLCCSLNAQSRHMVNREVLLALGKDGVIINVGRGALIDEKELVRCLIQGEIGGAGLDVFENEPHVPEELFAFDNVILTSHASSETQESNDKKCELIADSLEAFFVGKAQAIAPLKV